MLKLAQAAGIKGHELPGQAARHRRQLDRPAARAGGRRGRRRHPRLHARHGAGAHEGGDRPGPRRQGDVGIVDADRERVHGEAVPAVRREDVHQPGVRTTHATRARTPRSTSRSRRSTRRRSRLQAFGQMGFMDAKFATMALLNVKGPVTAASYNKAVRALKNVKTDMLCKPWYVGNAPVPHPEQHRHHRHVHGRQGRRQSSSASTSRRSTRSSPRRACGRRSSS